MGHWYDKEGNPRHFEGKDGKGTTLREARKLDLFPSVTTVGQVVAKFALTNWLQEEAAMMAAELLWDDCDIQRDDINRAWARTVVADSRDKTMAKADSGTDIHDILEKFQNNMEMASEHESMCAAVMKCIEENTDLNYFDDFQTETRFCNTEHGYAGMCDLHGSGWVIDYKTKDTVDDKTRGWPEQAEQLAAYRTGLLGVESTARLANVFISREDPTQVIWFEHKDPLAWKRFAHTLMLWQVTKKFGPYYESIK